MGVDAFLYNGDRRICPPLFVLNIQLPVRDVNNDKTSSSACGLRCCHNKDFGPTIELLLNMLEGSFLPE